MQPVNLYKHIKARVYSPKRGKDRKCISANGRSPGTEQKPIQKSWLDALMGIREKDPNHGQRGRCYSPILEKTRNLLSARSCCACKIPEDRFSMTPPEKGKQESSRQSISVKTKRLAVQKRDMQT